MVFCAVDDTLQLPLYATTIGYWEHQEETARSAGFPDYQLHQVLSGKGSWQSGRSGMWSDPERYSLLSRMFLIPTRQSAGNGSWHGYPLTGERREACFLMQVSGRQECAN